MTEHHIERVFKFRGDTQFQIPPKDVRVVIASTEGAVVGTAQTGGRMQSRMVVPKVVMISAEMDAGTPFGMKLREIAKKVEALGA